MERLFDALRVDPQLPPSEVDIARAVRTGRRRILVRRACAVALVVAAAALVPVLARPAGPGPFLDPAGQLTIEPEDFDPLQRSIVVTDVPGVEFSGFTTAARWQQVHVRIGRSGFAEVTVYAPGRPATAIIGEEAGLLNPEAGEPADPVRGGRAYWHTLDQGLTLAWRWGERGWAYVTVQDGAGADRGTAHRIATAVSVGEPRPVTMPFTVPEPEGLHLIGVTAPMSLPAPGAEFVRTGLRFAAEDPSDPHREVGAIAVNAERSDKASSGRGAERTVDGHPAMVDPGEVILFGFAEGFAVEVSAFRDNGHLTDIARSVRLVPDPGDSSTWTSDPVT